MFGKRSVSPCTLAIVYIIYIMHYVYTNVGQWFWTDAQSSPWSTNPNIACWLWDTTKRQTPHASSWLTGVHDYLLGGCVKMLVAVTWSGDQDLGRQRPCRGGRRSSSLSRSLSPSLTLRPTSFSPSAAAPFPRLVPFTFRFVSDLLLCSFSRFFIASSIPCKQSENGQNCGHTVLYIKFLIQIYLP